MQFMPVSPAKQHCKTVVVPSDSVAPRFPGPAAVGMLISSFSG